MVFRKDGGRVSRTGLQCGRESWFIIYHPVPTKEVIVVMGYSRGRCGERLLSEDSEGYFDDGGQVAL